jgi:hypothetical protein
MKKILIIASIFFCLSIFAQEAAPEVVPGTDAEHEKPCKNDRLKFCKDVKVGSGRIIKCLKEHEAELSESCKTFRTTKMNEAKENHGKCKADRKKFCKDVKAGEGRIIKCLKEHEVELSVDCKTVIADKK